MPRLSTIGAAATGAFGFGTLIPPVSADYVIVGAAGASGSGAGSGGGGGGQVRAISALLSRFQSYAVVVGAAGGNISSFNGSTANGGFVGADGNVGGSTVGGNGGASYAGFGGGSGDSVYFPPTGAPWTAGGAGWGGGGGGGAGGGGGNAASRNTPDYYGQGGNGGIGVVWSVNGNYYGGGGAGGGASYSNTDGFQPNASGGSPGNGFTAFGGDGRGGVIVSYVSATQLYTGGTVTSTGSGAATRWFHTFTTSANLVPI
jgi:hypothetical protein